MSCCTSSPASLHLHQANDFIELCMAHAQCLLKQASSPQWQLPQWPSPTSLWTLRLCAEHSLSWTSGQDQACQHALVWLQHCCGLWVPGALGCVWQCTVMMQQNLEAPCCRAWGIQLQVERNKAFASCIEYVQHTSWAGSQTLRLTSVHKRIRL